MVQGLPSHMAETNLRSLDRQAETGSYLSKYSYMLGWVDLYPPKSAPSAWVRDPWVIKVEKDADTQKPKTYAVKPMRALEAYTHIGLLPYRKDWLVTS